MRPTSPRCRSPSWTLRPSSAGFKNLNKLSTMSIYETSTSHPRSKPCAILATGESPSTLRSMPPMCTAILSSTVLEPSQQGIGLELACPSHLIECACVYQQTCPATLASRLPQGHCITMQPVSAATARVQQYSKLPPCQLGSYVTHSLCPQRKAWSSPVSRRFPGLPQQM